MSTKEKLQKRLANLSAKKRQLLLRKLKESNSDKTSLNAIPINRKELIPLSSPQARIWFFNQLYPTDTLYNRLTLYHVDGNLDTEVLEKTINIIIGRHEILRTIFLTQGGEPYQKILNSVEIPIEFIGLSKLDKKIQTERLDALIRQKQKKCFDLSKGPLVEFSILQFSKNQHAILIRTHHIIFDAWSSSVLVKEIAEIYKKIINQDHDLLPPLAIQYADYAFWQQKQSNDEKLVKNYLAYWKDNLSGSEPVRLFADYSRCSSEDNVGETVVNKLDVVVIDLLKKIATNHGVTLYVVLLTAFKVLLSRYTNQENIVVGMPCAGRNSQNLENLIGVFINTLPIETHIDFDMPFCDVLSQIQNKLIDTIDHQYLPFEKIAEELKIERDLEKNPLYQIMFQLREANIYSDIHDELTITEEIISPISAKLDISLDLEKSKSGIVCKCTYNKGLFRESTVSQFVRHYCALLEKIVTDIRTPVGKLEYFDENEKTKLLKDWNNTSKKLPIESTFHKEFENQVIRTPDHIAVAFKDKAISYKQLDEMANRLANYLIKSGAKQTQPIALCLNRSINTIVSVLGIMKAGCYYVPMDADYPRSRLHYIIDDANIKYVVTESCYELLYQEKDLISICVDTARDEIDNQSAGCPEIEVKPNDLIYVIYTSGTTGKPKGVMIEHRSVLNLTFYYYEKIFKSKKKDLKASLNAPLVFDASVQQLSFLLSGYTLYPVPDEVRHDIDDFIGFICNNQLDVLDFVPSQFQLLFDGGLLDKWHNKNALVLLGGEAINEKLWRELVKNKNIDFYNTYGPTECTVDTSEYYINGSQLGPVIGRPIANYSLYILDKKNNLVPIGMPGELHIGGVGVARGYLNRKELTREKFISNPFVNDNADRLYKTGDLVRYLPDGNVEYLGRIDQQVKLRGYRIELGEIESNLESHPCIKQALVIVYENKSGSKQLVAYLVEDNEVAGEKQDYSDYLGKKIPDYMIPSCFVPIDSIPLTINGKADKKSLPEPDVQSSNTKKYQHADTELEVELVKIWEELLCISRIGVLDNFFRLGGHSLLATRMLSRIKKVTRVKLTLRELFQYPIIRELASIISEKKSSFTEDNTASVYQKEITVIQKQTRGKVFPLTYPQSTLWLLDKLEGTSSTYNIPIAYSISGPLDIEILKSSFESIINRHESLRTSFIEIDGNVAQVINESATLDFNHEEYDPTSDQQTSGQQRAVDKFFIDNANYLFKLSNPSLLKVNLLKLRNEEYILFINVHHIIFDGWSWSVFLSELENNYNTFSNNMDYHQIEPNFHLVDFAVWQRDLMNGPEIENQVKYWRKTLQQLPEELILPQKTRRKDNIATAGSSESIYLPEEFIGPLNYLCNKESITPFMLFLSAYYMLLRRYSNREDIVIGTPLSGRNSKELEGAIGFFINVLAIRINPKRDVSYAELLQTVKNKMLDAFEHQDVPIEEVIELLKSTRQGSSTPPFQAMFVFQNFPENKLNLNQLTLKKINLEKTTSKVDFSLVINEMEGGLEACIEYNTGVYDKKLIRSMLNCYKTLLAGASEYLTDNIKQIPLLSNDDMKKIVVEWNSTYKQHPADINICKLFSQQVLKTPNNTAIHYEGSELSYQELENKSNQLAHFLLGAGIQTEDLVALCIEPSLEMVICILGIIKSGGAYLPIDPAYPEERKKYLLTDSGCKYLITRGHLLPEIQQTKSKLINIDEVQTEIKKMTTAVPTVDLQSNNLAYVIYTSGSTGNPKGVLLEHKGLCNLACAQIKAFNVNAQSRILQVASFSFDASVSEVFMALFSGATLYMAEKTKLYPGPELVRLLNEKQITTMTLTPSALARMPDDSISSLRDLVVAGESGSQELLTKWAGRVSLHNAYGPTEGTVCATINRNISGYEPTVIGKPMDNVQIYILDKNLQIAPVGVPGELYISGVGVARGYLNRPDLTRQCFIKNNFSDEPGLRLYRTGDLARYDDEGNIEFLGRIDHQVKIRGYRIELGEIESVLNQFPGVKQSVVAVREDRPGDQRLVAYYCEQNPNELDADDIRLYMKNKLPEYMVPYAYVGLEAIPLTPNGKVDRKSLPAPSLFHSNKNAIIAPRTELEQQLCEIWKEILNQDQIGIDDNFFDIGGHSLLLIQIAARVRSVLSVDVPLRVYFEAPTIAEMAVYITTLRAQDLAENDLLKLLDELDDLPGNS